MAEIRILGFDGDVCDYEEVTAGQVVKSNLDSQLADIQAKKSQLETDLEQLKANYDELEAQEAELLKQKHIIDIAEAQAQEKTEQVEGV